MFERLLSVYVLCAACVTAAEAVAIDAQAQDGLNTFRIRERIVADGFSAETHHVTTFDGYILEMHRIPHGRGEVSDPEAAKRPIVFLMHGLLSASDAFIVLGADYSIAYNLADAGFDVWMGNARGNRYSRHHITLDPDDEIQKFLFFDFTFEEIGLHDLPAMMDYALEYTGNQQLHYIGHSQGGTVYLVLTTLRPLYNIKIASAHLLAGVGYQEYFPDKGLAAFAADVDNIYRSALEMGIVELYPEFLQPPRAGDMSDECTGALVRSNKCKLEGVKRILANNSFDATVNVPPGASLKQAAHYGQNIRDKLFRRYHFGIEENRVNYGLEDPPLYNLGIISSDVTMHYSMSDNLLDERDVLAMVADMPNARARRVARDTFGHADYIASFDAKELVTDYIIEALKNTPIFEIETSTGVNTVSVADYSPTTTPPESSSTTSPDESSSTSSPDESSSTASLDESSSTNSPDESSSTSSPDESSSTASPDESSSTSSPDESSSTASLDESSSTNSPDESSSTTTSDESSSTTSPDESSSTTSPPDSSQPPVLELVVTTEAPGFAPGIELNMTLLLLSSIMLMIKQIFIV